MLILATLAINTKIINIKAFFTQPFDRLTKNSLSSIK